MLRRVHFVLLISVAFTIPFDLPLVFTQAKLNNILISLLAANTCLLFFYGKKEMKPLHPVLISLILLYAVYVSGLLQTDNLRQAITDLTEKKIVLLLFPLIFYFSPSMDQSEKKRIVLAFAVSCLITVLFCISVATYRFFMWDDYESLTYHKLSSIAGMHGNYLALFCCFSIAILLYLYYKELHRLSVAYRTILLVTILILVTAVFLLSSRTQIGLLILFAIGFFVYHFRKTTNLKSAVIRAVVIGTVITGIVFLFPNNRERFNAIINYNNEFGLSTKWGEQQMRPLMWACALDLVKQHYLTGVGIADGQDQLHQCYIDREYVSLTYFDSQGVRFNAHNQFLEILIELGIIGLLAFMASLLVPFIHALKAKNTIYLIFLIFFAVSCLTESFLQRQNGCVFFGFFCSFLLTPDRQNEKSPEPQ